MKVEKKGNATIIKETKEDLASFITKITNDYKTFEKENLIIDVTIYNDFSITDSNLFLPLIKMHKKSKKSLIIVHGDFDYNATSDKITIVPSLLEAHDIIEMDEIERDLGF